MPKSEGQVQRLKVLDSFRGLCALFVALHHFKANGVIAQSAFVKNAFLLVDFFFVLSGFVIARRYFEPLSGGGQVIAFMRKRFARLYPLHVAALSPFLLIELFLMPYFSADRAPFSGPMTWEALGINLVMLNSVWLTDGLTWNYPSWSIGAEFLTYGVFAAISAAWPSRSAAVAHCVFAVAAVLCLAVIAAISPDYIDATHDLGFLRCLAGFSVGVLVWRLGARRGEPAALARLSGYAAGAIEAALLAAVVAFVIFVGHTPANLASPLLFGIVVYVFAFEKGAVARLFRARLLLLLGLISYSIYMVHAFFASRVFSGGLQLLERFAGFKPFAGGDSRLFGATPLEGDLMTLLYLILVLAAASVTYRLIERPSQLLL